MASPGQRKGACGHIMASFDRHSRCARCREKGLGEDPCISKLPCEYCELLTPDQVIQLATPTYRQTSYEAYSVAPQKTLEGPRITGKGDSGSKDSPPAPTMVDQGDKCLARSTSAPSASCHSNLYRCLKRRLGCSLRRLHSKRHLVSSRKSTAYKFPGTKGCLAGTKKVPAHGTRESHSSCHRQHCSCCIHKQGGRYEVRLTLCPSMAAPVLVQSETCCPKGQTHPWSSECDCGQIVSTRPNNSDRMVSSSRGIRPPVSNLAPSPGRHVCDQVQLQANQVCVSSTRPQCLGSGRSNISWENLDMYAFPPVLLLGKVVSKLSDHLYKRVILIAPGWPNMPWFWDLVDLSSQIPLCLPNHPDLVTQLFNKARHRDLTSLNLHAWLLEPRQSRSKGSLAQWRYGLSLLKDVQPEQSMRQSGPFLLDGMKQVRWTSGLHLSNK